MALCVLFLCVVLWPSFLPVPVLSFHVLSFGLLDLLISSSSEVSSWRTDRPAWLVISLHTSKEKGSIDHASVILSASPTYCPDCLLQRGLFADLTRHIQRYFVSHNPVLICARLDSRHWRYWGDCQSCPIWSGILLPIPLNTINRNWTDRFLILSQQSARLGCSVNQRGVIVWPSACGGQGTIIELAYHCCWDRMAQSCSWFCDVLWCFVTWATMSVLL